MIRVRAAAAKNTRAAMALSNQEHQLIPDA